MLTSVSFPKNVLCTSLNWLKLSTCQNRFAVVFVLSIGCKVDNRHKVTMQTKKKNEVSAERGKYPSNGFREVSQFSF